MTKQRLDELRAKNKLYNGHGTFVLYGDEVENILDYIEKLEAENAAARQLEATDKTE